MFECAFKYGRYAPEAIGSCGLVVCVTVHDQHAGNDRARSDVDSEHHLIGVDFVGFKDGCLWTEYGRACERPCVPVTIYHYLERAEGE